METAFSRNAAVPMTIDYQQLKAFRIDDIVQEAVVREGILYALGVGVGSSRPDNPLELPFVYEDSFRFLPMFSTVIAQPGAWIARPETGIAWTQCLNGEFSVEFHRQLQPCESVRGQFRIDDAIDKGPGRGALLYVTRTLTGASSDDLICVIQQTIFARADGGFGGPSGPIRPAMAVPDRAPDIAHRDFVPHQAALIYRLTGDLNPLHVDPAFASRAGFQRPILHGAATYGFAGVAVLKELCSYDPSRLKRLNVRFSRPVYPGETLCTELWRLSEGRAALRMRVEEREAIVLDNGYLEFVE